MRKNRCTAILGAADRRSGALHSYKFLSDGSSRMSRKRLRSAVLDKHRSDWGPGNGAVLLAVDQNRPLACAERRRLLVRDNLCRAWLRRPLLKVGRRIHERSRLRNSSMGRGWNVLVRLVAAPFEIAKADATKIRELEQKLAAHLGPARNGWFSYAIRYGVFGRWPQNDDDLALPCFSIYDGSTLSDEDAKVITRAKLVLRFLRQAASDGHAHLTVWGYSNPGELILGAQDSDEKTLVKIDASHWETYTVDIEDVLSNPAHVHTKQPNHPMFDEGSFSALRVCKEQVESVLAAKQSEIEEYLSADA
jgi:hypothetical protein